MKKITKQNIVKKTGVFGIIENDEGEILLSQRIQPDIPSAHLKWDFIGGTNDVGESFEETLIREIKEETGLDVEILNQISSPILKNWEHKEYTLEATIICFSCLFKKGKLTLKDSKIKQLIWTRPADALKKDLMPTTKHFIEIFCKEKN